MLEIISRAGSNLHNPIKFGPLIPATSNSIPLQGSGIENNDLSAGFNRAKLAWYNIDPIFYSRKRPSGISDNSTSVPANALVGTFKSK